MSAVLSRDSAVCGNSRTYFATLGSFPVSLRNSGTKCGFGKNRTSNTRSASVGTPFLNPKLFEEIINVSDRVEPLSFRTDRLHHGIAAPHRMRPSRLGETANQRLITRLEEEHS